MAILRRVPSSIWLLLAVAAAFSFGFHILASALARPTVYTSWDTKKCVHAEDSKGNPIDCSAAGDQYYNVWVY